MNTQAQSYSHPDKPVRHSYPLAVNQDTFMTAVNLSLKTMPYILMRLGILLAFTVAAIVWLALCGGIAYLFSSKDGSGGGGLLLFLLGFGLPAGAFFWLRQYVLYLLKCGHVAVLTKLITEGSLPSGVNQVEYGKKVVMEHFAQTNVLVLVDSLVTGTARAFNSSLDWLSSLIPIPGMDSVMKFVHAIVNQTATFLDETILSYTLARGDENVWRSSMDGLIYYAANVKPILKTAVLCVLIQYASLFVLFLVCLIPSYAIAQVLPVSVSSYSWIFAVALAAAFKAAFLDPVFLTMVALTFHKSVVNQPINEALSDTLTSLTSKFTELKEKAAGFVSKNSESSQAIAAN